MHMDEKKIILGLFRSLWRKKELQNEQSRSME
ncbi:hypothetical protein JOC62_003380 [Clostridium sardiniense]|nr:hypothetical protein [Clostridium sardiniense]